MNLQPRVSVLFRLHTLHEYYESSLNSLLNGSYREIEILILNTSGSEIPDYISSNPRIRIISIPTTNKLGKILNIGIKESSGNYIAIMDSDDLATANRFDLQVNIMEQNVDLGFTSSAAIIIGIQSIGKLKVNSCLDPVSNNEELWETLLSRNPIVHSTVMYRKSAILNSNLYYSEKIKVGEDFEFWTRLVGKINYAGIAEVLVEYRVHGEQTVNTKKLSLQKQVNDARLKFAIYTFVKKAHLRASAASSIKHCVKKMLFG
jgi:glycosyltransferase involved in cell wall biosynthesis